MSILTIENLSKSYFSQQVLDNVSLSLDRGDRLGLIGHNGSGKTTLLRLISGLETPDNEEARIHIADGIIPAYLKQEFTSRTSDNNALEHPEFQTMLTKLRLLEEAMQKDPHNEQTLHEYARINAWFDSSGAWDYPHRLAQTAASLGLNPEKIKRDISTLSGGERMRLELATILVQNPDLILLDEPTNHLDVEATEWLEKELANSKSALIVVSHDRHFLDEVCNIICEINNGHLTIYRGNYSKFKDLQARERLRLSREEEKLEKEIKHEAEVVQTLYSHRKISSYHSRRKKLAKLNDSLKDLRDKTQRNSPQFKLRYLEEAEARPGRRLLISARDLSVQFPDASTKLFNPLDIDIYSGNKILFVGPNGCGKSNLLRALSAQNPYLQGDIRLDPSLRYANLDQTERFSDANLTVIETLMSYDDSLTYGRAREVLASYGFFDLELEKKVFNLSGGEKSRLALACILLQKPDLLFLDEPTNHLDINSSEILENALQTYQGTVIAVSHDRYFIEKIANQVFGFLGKEIKEFPHYQAYRNAVQATKLIEKAEDNTAAQIASPNENHQEISEMSFFDEVDHKIFPQLKNLPTPSKNRQVERQLRAQISEIMRNIEEEISELEIELADLEASFGQDDSAKLYEDYGKKQIRVEKLLDLYVKADEILEQFK